MLSAVAYGGQPGAESVLKACVAGFKALPVVRRRFSGSLMSIFETYRPVSDWGRLHFRNGKAAGEAEALFTVLSARGFDVSDDVRSRITECTDSAQLSSWIRRALTIGKVEELFD